MRADCRKLYEAHYSKQSFADTLTAAVKELTEGHYRFICDSLFLHTTSPSLLRNATSPCRGGTGESVMVVLDE